MRDAYYEWLSEVRVDPDHLAEVGAVRFLFGEVILFPPSHTWLLGSKSRQPACRGYLNYSPPSRGHSIYLYYLKCFYMLYCRFSSAYLLTEALIYTVAPPPHPAPPYPQLCLPWSQLPTVNLGLEEDGLPSDTCQKVNSSYTMPHAHIIDLTSFITGAFYHLASSQEEGWAQDHEGFWERMRLCLHDFRDILVLRSLFFTCPCAYFLSSTSS